MEASRITRTSTWILGRLKVNNELQSTEPAVGGDFKVDRKAKIDCKSNCYEKYPKKKMHEFGCSVVSVTFCCFYVCFV